MNEQARSCTYFASDFHLGVDFKLTSSEREKIIISWLESIGTKARALYLVGDIFDYWFEYKYVVPKGAIRLLGALADMADRGVEVHYFKGNHDMWIYDYFQQEMGFIIHDHSLSMDLDGRAFFVAHGDGLGKGDMSYKMIKAVLRNKVAQKLFASIHPSVGLPMMRLMSRRSRQKEQKHGPDLNQENIVAYAEDLSHSKHLDFFICGHRHYPMLKTLSNGRTQYCNLGDWMTHFTYAVWDGDQLMLEKYEV